jgi:hypothetical protein
VSQGSQHESQGRRPVRDRRNPFVYFIALAADLKAASTTPNLAYISPNLCNDGHDAPCVDGRPGGLASADEWLQQQVPAIQDSPAFRQDGTLVITFDEPEAKEPGPADIPGGTAGGRGFGLPPVRDLKGGVNTLQTVKTQPE